MVIRRGSDRRALHEGEQLQIGGIATDVALCRRHWRQAMAGCGRYSAQIPCRLIHSSSASTGRGEPAGNGSASLAPTAPA